MDTKLERKAALVYSETARKAIDIGALDHHIFSIVGSGGIPEEAYYQGDWWIEPVNEPQEGQDRIRALRAAGIPIKGFVIAHEVTIKVGEEMPKINEVKTRSDFQNPPPDILPAVEGIATIVVSGLAFLIAGIFLAVLRDPVLIAVIDDNIDGKGGGTWLSIMTWYE